MIDYYKFMQDSLSNLVSSLSRISNNKFTDNIRSMIKSLIQAIDSCRFMQSTLSDLIDKLSEINNKDCIKCMERKKIRSECEFIGFKDNRLNHKCKECNDTSAKSVDDLKEKFSNTCRSCNNDINKSYYYQEKVFILIWTHGKDLMKQSYLIKNLFTVN